MALFDNSEPEELLLFVGYLNMNLGSSVTLVPGKNIKYLCTLLNGELLRQFDMLYAEVGITTSENLKNFILGSGTYFFLLMSCHKKKRSLRRVMNKPHSLKEICYAAHMIDINDCLYVFPWVKESDKIVKQS